MPVALAEAPPRRTLDTDTTMHGGPRRRRPHPSARRHSSAPGTPTPADGAAPRDEARRGQLITDHLPLVRQVAARMARRLPHADVDDLIGWGTEGLIAAVDRFDPSKGVALDRFAAPRIQGAIIDGLRSLDWVGGSRIRLRERALRQASDVLTVRMGRSPSTAELAEELGWTVRRVQRSLSQGARSHLEALDAVAGVDESGEPTTFAELLRDTTATPEDRALDADTRRRLRRAVAKLPEHHRRVLRHYFADGMKLAEIGQAFGVSEGRICQINRDSLRRLHLALAES